MWLDVIVVFANLNELFEHRRGKVGNSELAPSKEILKLVEGSKSEMIDIDKLIHALLKNDPDCIERSVLLLVSQAAFSGQAYDNTKS